MGLLDEVWLDEYLPGFPQSAGDFKQNRPTGMERYTVTKAEQLHLTRSRQFEKATCERLTIGP